VLDFPVKEESPAWMLTVEPSGATLNPERSSTDPAASFSLSPVLITTEPDARLAAEPVVTLTEDSSSAVILLVVLNLAVEAPVTVAIPPAPAEPAPAVMVTEPPVDPPPETIVIDPPASFSSTLEPTRRAMLPELLADASPVESRMDPDTPWLEPPVPSTMSPVLYMDSFEPTTIDPLAPSKLDPPMTTADPPALPAEEPASTRIEPPDSSVPPEREMELPWLFIEPEPD
jgi:hypothetical protein